MDGNEPVRQTGSEDFEARFRTAQGSLDTAYEQVEAAARRSVAAQPLLALVLAGLTGYALSLALHARR